MSPAQLFAPDSAESKSAFRCDPAFFARIRAVVTAAAPGRAGGVGIARGARASGVGPQLAKETPFAPPLTQKFGLPELTPRLLGPVEAEDHWITFRAAVAIITDYASFDQDHTSISQVGQQKDQWDTRALRLVFAGTLLKTETVGYLIAGDYNGFDEDPEANWNVLDFSVFFLLGDPSKKLTLGKMKETFDYEMVGDAAFLPHQERVLNPFFVSRNIGVRYSQVIGADPRMTAAVGVFNDWFRTDDSFENSGTDVTARFTGLAWYREGRQKFPPSRGFGPVCRPLTTTPCATAPGRNRDVSDYYLDTGNLPGDHAWHTGLELLWNDGPFSVLAEYNRAQVSSSSSGNPQFFGGCRHR